MNKLDADQTAIETSTTRKDKENKARIASIQSEGATATTSQPRSDKETPVGEIPLPRSLSQTDIRVYPRPKLQGSLKRKFAARIYTNFAIVRVAGIETAKRISHSKMIES